MMVKSAKSIKREKKREAKAKTIKRHQERVLTDALAAVQVGDAPKLLDGDDYAVVHIIDPQETEKRFTPKVCALRDDPIGRMYRRGHLKREGDRDERDAGIRYEAARLWQGHYAKAEIGSAKAIDPTRDVVDGGGEQVAEVDQRLAAVMEMVRMDRLVRRIDAELLRMVRGECRQIIDVAETFGLTSKFGRLHLGRRIVDTLETIAQSNGLKSQTGPRTAAQGRRVR